MVSDPTTAPAAAAGSTAAARPVRRWLVAALALVLAVGLGACGTAGTNTDAVTAPPTSTANATAAPPAWERRDALHTPRDDFGTVIVDGQIWVAGGMTADRGNKLATTEIYDPATDDWSLGTPMPTGRSSLAVVELDGVVYAMGGSTAADPYLDVVEAINPADGEWARTEPMLAARYEHGAVALDGKIYVIGGSIESGPTGSVEIYDPARREWSAGPSLAIPRTSLRTAVLDGVIYAVGGLGLDGLQADVEVFDPAIGTWQPGPALPEAIVNFGLTTYDGELHAIWHQYHFVLTSGDTEWRTEESPPVIRHGLGMIELGGLLYAIGGCTEEPLRDVNTVQVWQG